MPLMFPTCQQIEFFLCMSALCVSQGLLYIGPDIIFGIYFLTCTSHSSHFFWPTSMRAEEAWHSPEALSQSWAAGIWGSSLQFCSVLAAPFLLRPPLLILPFYFQPASKYNTEEPCAVLCCEHRHTPVGVHTHPHFYKPLKETRPKAERGADASQMLRLGSMCLLTQTAAHKITVVYCLWKDPLPHSTLSSSGDS